MAAPKRCLRVAGIFFTWRLRGFILLLKVCQENVTWRRSAFPLAFFVVKKYERDQVYAGFFSERKKMPFTSNQVERNVAVWGRNVQQRKVSDRND